MTKVVTALKLVLAVVMPLLVASGVFSLFYFPTRLLTDACAGEGACAGACMLCYVPVGLGGLVGGLLGLTTLLAGLPTGIGWALHSSKLRGQSSSAQSPSAQSPSAQSPSAQSPSAQSPPGQ